ECLTQAELASAKALEVKEPVEGYVSPEVASAEHLQITEASGEDADALEA
ncbi:unnamed protein product, partial [Symbiodinium pilosum]